MNKIILAIFFGIGLVGCSYPYGLSLSSEYKEGVDGEILPVGLKSKLIYEIVSNEYRKEGGSSTLYSYEVGSAFKNCLSINIEKNDLGVEDRFNISDDGVFISNKRKENEIKNCAQKSIEDLEVSGKTLLSLTHYIESTGVNHFKKILTEIKSDGKVTYRESVRVYKLSIQIKSEKAKKYFFDL